MGACYVCRRPAKEYDAHYEADERDKFADKNPIVFIGRGPGHERCAKALEDHPRLYSKARGNPGSFPRLCGSCTRRVPNTTTCSHPDLLANGGAGLKVDFDLMAAVVCVRGRGFSGRPTPTALTCAGQKLPGE